MNEQSYPYNPFAPVYFGGLEQPPPEVLDKQPKPFGYVYSPPGGQLSANQGPFQDTLPLYADSDWLMEAWYISHYTGPFQIKLTDSNGYELMSGMVHSDGISRSNADPSVFSPAHPFPASGKVLIQIQDLSGDTNPLQIVFPGPRLYKVRT